MSMKLNTTPAVWMNKPETFYDVGVSLRQAFQPALSSETAPGVEALLKLLMDTPLNDMACC